eukprot:s1356_g16.t1
MYSPSSLLCFSLPGLPPSVVRASSSSQTQAASLQGRHQVHGEKSPVDPGLRGPATFNLSECFYPAVWISVPSVSSPSQEREQYQNPRQQSLTCSLALGVE